MKNFFITLILLSLIRIVSAQETENVYQGTIKVQKKGQLSKVVFDNVNFRLIGIDQYGNVLDSAVVEYKISVTVRGIFYSEQTVGPFLSYNLREQLQRCDQPTKIFFDKIKAKDRSGSVLDVPKFQYQFSLESFQGYGE